MNLNDTPLQISILDIGLYMDESGNTIITGGDESVMVFSPEEDYLIEKYVQTEFDKFMERTNA